MSARTISVVNQKGGVGKTTTAVNLGAALASRGHSVLLVDMDPQSNLTTHLGLGEKNMGMEVEESLEKPPVPEFTVYDVLKGNKKISEVILNRSNMLDVAPASLLLLSTGIFRVGFQRVLLYRLQLIPEGC